MDLPGMVHSGRFRPIQVVQPLKSLPIGLHYSSQLVTLGPMENNYRQIAAHAIAIECVKNTHDNQHAPVNQVNTQVSHWNISQVNINGTPIAEWCAQFDLDLQELFGHYFTNPFKTKKQALAWAIETFADFVAGIDPEENWFRPAEMLEACTAAFASIEGSINA